MNRIEVIKEDAEHVILRRGDKTLTLYDDDALRIADEIMVCVADYRARHKEEDASET